MLERPGPVPSAGDGPNRRGFAARWLMLMGLGGSYGLLAAFAARFLYPARPAPRAWLYAAEVDRLRPGESLAYVTPAGDRVLITRRGEGRSADDFIALSSICPHLGCRVHYEAQNARYFCPCHNGAFDLQGRPTEGPPAADNRSLPRYALKVERGLLFIDVPLESLSTGATRTA